MSALPDDRRPPVMTRPRPATKAPALPVVDPGAARSNPLLGPLARPDQVDANLDALSRQQNPLSLPPTTLKHTDEYRDPDAPRRALEELDEPTARLILQHCDKRLLALNTTMARLVQTSLHGNNKDWIADLRPLVAERSLLEAHVAYIRGRLEGNTPGWSPPTTASIDLDLCKAALDLYLGDNPVYRLLELIQSVYKRRTRLAVLEAAEDRSIPAFLSAARQLEAPKTPGWKPAIPPVADLVAAIGHGRATRELISRYRRDADECLAALPTTMASLVAHVVDDVAGGVKDATAGVAESLLLMQPIGTDEGEIREVEEQLAELGATPKSATGGKVVAQLQSEHARLVKASASRRAGEKSQAEATAATVLEDAMAGDPNGYGRLALAAMMHPACFNPSVGEALRGVPARLVAGHYETYGRSIGF